MGRPGSSIRLRTKHHPLPILDLTQDVDRRQSGSIERKQIQIIIPILPRPASCGPRPESAM